MKSTRISAQKMITVTLALACVALTVVWPQWRDELRAQQDYCEPEQQDVDDASARLDTARAVFDRAQANYEIAARIDDAAIAATRAALRAVEGPACDNPVSGSCLVAQARLARALAEELIAHRKLRRADEAVKTARAVVMLAEEDLRAAQRALDECLAGL